MFDPDLYRDRAEVERWKDRDPISSYSEALMASGIIGESDLEAIWASAREETEDAVEFAEAAPFESEDSLLRHVYADVNGGVAT